MEYNYYNISGNTATVLYETTQVIVNMGNNRSARSEEGYNTDFSSNYKSTGRQIKKMSICNTHATDTVSVDLYASNVTYNQSNDPSRGIPDENNTLDVVEDTTTIYYLLKGVKIPVGVTMSVDLENELCFNAQDSTLFIQLGASDSKVDIITKEY